jgi:hypothetical protein
MENLLAPFTLPGNELIAMTKPATRIQMIAVDEIGRFAAEAFTRPRSSTEPRSTFAGASIDHPTCLVISKNADRAAGFLPVGQVMLGRSDRDAPENGSS